MSLFLRITILVICQVAIIACILVAWSEPGWQQLGLDIKIVISWIGGASFLLLAMLVVKPEIKLVQTPGKYIRKRHPV
jgi:hypothetical protein